jgi:hypothetical protein
MTPALRDGTRVLVLLALVASITVGLQWCIGDATLYSKELEGKREMMHNAILTNVAPRGGSWADVGAASHNIRIGTIYLAEALRIASGAPLGTVYKAIDTLFLFSSLVGLYFYLRLWLPDAFCLIGLLYFSVTLPLTYFQHYFEPWDRLQLSIWILLLYLVRERQLWILGICLALSMLVKFDTILLPGLYFLVYVSRQRWWRVSLESAALFAVSFGIYLVLKVLLPTPLDQPRFALDGALLQIQSNVATLLSLNFRDPPLLVFTVPVLLALIGIRSRDRFIQSSVLFAFGLSVIWFVFTIHSEVRAQLPALVLLLPAALLSLQSLLEHRSDEADAAPLTGSRRDETAQAELHPQLHVNSNQ